MTYVSGQTGGKLCPEGETDRRPLSRLAVMVSVLSVVLSLLILCSILGWLWKPPSPPPSSHLQSDQQVLAAEPR